MNWFPILKKVAMTRMFDMIPEKNSRQGDSMGHNGLAVEESDATRTERIMIIRQV